MKIIIMILLSAGILASGILIYKNAVKKHQAKMKAARFVLKGIREIDDSYVQMAKKALDL